MPDPLELARDIKFVLRKLLEKLEAKNKSKPVVSSSQEELAVV